MTPTDAPTHAFEFPTITGRLRAFERPRGVTDLAAPIAGTADALDALAAEVQGGGPALHVVPTDVEAVGVTSASRIFRTAATRALVEEPFVRPRGAELPELTLPPTADAIVHGASIVIPDQAPAGPEARGLGPADPQLASLAARPLRELSDADLTLLIDRLSLRDTAREAFRARLIAWASVQRQRSAYEIVFLMLAACVTVLLCGPTMIRLALALNGHG